MMMTKLVTALVLFGTFSIVISNDCSCGVENSVSRIIGGTEVSKGKYPWIAFLLITKGANSYACAGSIINDLYILTAAHCMQDAVKVEYSVGSIYDYTESELQTADSFFQHPEYNPDGMLNDIGLVKLAEPLVWSKIVRPVCLPKENMDLSGDLIVAGWGLTKGGDKVNSHVLMEATIEEYSFDYCNLLWTNLVESQFCAGRPGHGACEGDSGGPIMKHSNGRVYNVGIVSYGDSNCEISERNVNTRVSSFIDWIKENTSDGTYCDN